MLIGLNTALSLRTLAGLDYLFNTALKILLITNAALPLIILGSLNATLSLRTLASLDYISNTALKILFIANAAQPLTIVVDFSAALPSTVLALTLLCLQQYWP